MTITTIFTTFAAIIFDYIIFYCSNTGGREMSFIQSNKSFIGLGILSGLLFVVVAYMGNPPNMALCAACFIRDMTGALKLHTTATVQYFRPEIVGIIFGAFAMSIRSKEFSSLKGTAAPVRFALGFIMMLCALVFLGCPLRMVLRMGAGDMSGFVGLGGFLVGIAAGTFFLKKGFFLGEGTAERKSVGYGFTIITLVLFLIGMGTTLYAFSTSGPGSMHAPVVISLVVGIIFGAIAQKTRMCFSGAFREAMFYKSVWRLLPIISIFVVVVIYNLVMGTFHVAAYGPIAHDNTLWNVLAMFGVGMSATLAGGCPLRHLVLGASGSTDSAVTVLGMIAGAAAAHNFNMASAPSTIKAGEAIMGGPAFYGQVGVIISLILLVAIGIWGSKLYGCSNVQKVQQVEG